MIREGDVIEFDGQLLGSEGEVVGRTSTRLRVVHCHTNEAGETIIDQVEPLGLTLLPPGQSGAGG